MQRDAFNRERRGLVWQSHGSWAAVGQVAQDRVSLMSKMNPNLVALTAERPRPPQERARKNLLHLELRRRGARVDGLADSEHRHQRPPRGQIVVEFHDSMLAEKTVRLTMTLGGEREEDHAARLDVQTVRDQCRRFPLAQPVHEHGRFRVTTTRDRQPACRLVDDHPTIGASEDLRAQVNFHDLYAKTPLTMRGKTFSKILGTLTLIILGLPAVFALGPDRDTRFERSVPSSLSPQELDANLRSFSRWPLWHYDVIEVRAVESLDDVSAPVVLPEPAPDASGALPLPRVADPADLPLGSGRWIRFTVEPKGHSWKRFFLYAEVLRYTPARELRLRLVRDSKGRIPKMLSDLEWGVSVRTPEEAGMETTSERRSVLHGELRARTASWKARLFVAFAERILMHQVFYANLQELSYMKEGIQRPPRRRGATIL